MLRVSRPGAYIRVQARRNGGEGPLRQPSRPQPSGSVRTDARLAGVHRGSYVLARTYIDRDAELAWWPQVSDPKELSDRRVQPVSAGRRVAG